MTTINELDPKLAIDAADEFEIHDWTEPDPLKRSKKVSAAAVLGSGLEIDTERIRFGETGLFIERVSDNRIRIMFGTTPVLNIDSDGDLHGHTGSDWRVQRQAWPNEPMYSSAGHQSSGFGFPVPGEVGIAAGGVEVARLRTNAGAVNRLQVTPAPTGQAVDVEAVGDDVDVDLRLAGKGAGTVRVGELVPATDPAAFVATHRLELKAEDGTPVYLGVSLNAF